MVMAAKKLYAEGGMARYYAGIGPALFQGPIGKKDKSQSSVMFSI